MGFFFFISLSKENSFPDSRSTKIHPCVEDITEGFLHHLWGNILRVSLELESEVSVQVPEPPCTCVSVGKP